MHRINKILHARAPGLLLPILLGACQQAPDSPPTQELSPAAAADRSCGDDASLSTTLYGSIERRISWSAETLGCESMLRPEEQGVRLRFTGDVEDKQLSIILALPELQREATGPESPTVVTLIVEGSGRFFSTASLGSCWSDIITHDRIGDNGSRYDISGTLYCIAPLGEINGNAAISIPEMAFRTVVDWSET